MTVITRTDARPFKRAGLHRLNCPTCPAYVYATVAALERHGRPVCACGTVFVPSEVELADLLGVDCAAVEEYRREVESIWKGQAAHGARLGSRLQDPHTLAMSRIVARRRQEARTRRVAALKPAPEPMPF